MRRLMKRSLIALGVVVLVLIVSFGVLFGPVFMDMRPVPEAFEHNGVALVRDGFTTAWIVPLGEDRVALIDAGNDASGGAILAALSDRGLGADAVAAIFLTHGHPDHTAAVPLFPDAEIMALAAEVDLIAGRTAAASPLGRVMPVTPTGIEVTRPLQDGELVTFANRAVKVYSVPGHTAGSAGYLVDGVLILGDAGNVSADGTVKAPPWVFSEDLDLARASLAELGARLEREQLEVEVIAFAHSGPLRGGPAALTAVTDDQ